MALEAMWRALREQMSAIIVPELNKRENGAYDDAAEAIADSCRCGNPKCCAREAALRVMQLQYKMSTRKPEEQ